MKGPFCSLSEDFLGIENRHKRDGIQCHCVFFGNNFPQENKNIFLSKTFFFERK